MGANKATTCLEHHNDQPEVEPEGEVEHKAAQSKWTLMQSRGDVNTMLATRETEWHQYKEGEATVEEEATKATKRRATSTRIPERMLQLPETRTFRPGLSIQGCCCGNQG